MPKRLLIQAPHLAGGTTYSRGERNLTPQQNLRATNMDYAPEGAAITGPGWGIPSGWESIETGHGVDGLFSSRYFPGLILKAVNGKIKQSASEGGAFYNVDTGLSLTAGLPVLFREYRGNVYYCNGTDAMGRIPVGQLASQITAASTSVPMDAATGYRFTNGADKAYVEGDEIDYTGVSTDTLTTASNIGATHAAGAYVTQHKALTAPPSGSLKAYAMEIWRDTMWYSASDEPTVLRYSKTVDAVGNVGYIHDFSDGENYLIGESGDITALKSSRDRLYVFKADRTEYITIELTSSGTEAFSRAREFTGIHGCPNPFCVAEMEDVIVFFTGRRLIRIGYNPDADQILPDEKFDADILPLLQRADADQSGARLHYSPASKRLFLTFAAGGVYRTAVLNTRVDRYAYPWTHDACCYAEYGGATYFGGPDDDEVFKFGNSLDGDGREVARILTTGRLDGETRQAKRFLRGMVEGRKAVGTDVTLSVLVNGKLVGGYRTIGDEHMDAVPADGALGDAAIGDAAVGGTPAGAQAADFRYPFLINRIGEDVQLQFSSLQDSAYWEIHKYQVEHMPMTIPYTHY